jgi:phage-related protein (TIGR01555 family)
MQKITMKAQNIILSSRTGAGNTELDRGAGQTSNWATTNPFHRTDYFNRWRELINWYYTSWMARKGVDIPVEDAMRGGFQIRKIDPTVSKRLKRRFDQLKVTDKLERACKQERLLGGCALLIVVRDSRAGDSTARMSDPLNLKLISKNPGAIMALNMADIYRIALPQQNNDLFDPTFDDPRSYLIDGVEVDKSRLVVFDGKPLFGRVSYNIMFPVPRVNPGGFGESILTPVYEDLLRANGTAQAAYHLVNMASVLLVLMQEYTGLQSSKAGEQKIVEMERIVNSISLYKGAILDGVGVDVKSLPASFGGVPDLVKQFVANLAAAWDIPMTRFLGMSPGE